MKNKLFFQKGFTLIEILVVLTLCTVVLGLGYEYFSIGTNFFSRGERQGNVQRNVRLATDFITNEIRYSQKLEILEELPISFNEDYNYIYIDEEGQLKQVHKNQTRHVLGALSNGLEFSLLFSQAVKQDPEGTLGETIKVGDGKTLNLVVSIDGESFEIGTSIFLDYLENTLEEKSGGIIVYQVPQWVGDVLVTGGGQIEDVDISPGSGCDCSGCGC